MAPPRARRTALSKRSHPVALALALALAVMSCLGGTLSTPATAATPAPTASAVGGGDASVTGALASFYR
ncbi:MAG: hypothetical protein ABSB09_03990, partial [Acidimicrobiales bacterium]